MADTWCLLRKGFLAVLLGTIVLLLPISSNSQSLNQAVDEQLRLGFSQSKSKPIVLQNCAELLGTDPPEVLKGELFELCEPSSGPSGPPSSGSSSAGGGGQGTATTRPAVLEERLEKARGEKESEENDDVITLEFGKVGVFLSGEYENFNKDRTKFEDGYNSIFRRLIVGADIQLTKNILAGLVFDTHRQDGRFDGPVGNFEVDSHRFVAFGSFLPISNFFVQASVNYGNVSTERKRDARFEQDADEEKFEADVQGTPRADFDADQYGAFITTGYNFRLGSVTLSPRAGYEWQRVAYETYRESGSSGLELKFEDFDITSSLSTLGLMGSIAIGTRYGVLVPQASFDWKHQFDLDQQTLDVSFIDDTRSKKFGKRSRAIIALSL